MKNTVIRTILVLFALSTIGTVACGIDTSTPEGTVRAFLQAWAADDTNTMANYQANDYSRNINPVLKEAMDDRLTNAVTKKISIPQVSTYTPEDTSVQVLAKWTMAVTLSDGSQTSVSSGTGHSLFTLTKIDGNWLVSLWNVN